MIPFCIKCGDDYNPKRRELGYRTCLSCGSPKYEPPIIYIAKSNPVVGTMAELKQGTQGHKGSSNYS